MLKKLATLFLSFLLFLFFYSPIQAQTKDWNSLGIPNCYDDTKNPLGIKIATLQGLECIFANIMAIIIPLAGLAAFIVLIVGGFQYLTSAGDPKQAQKAQSIITSAIIGIAVIALIWFIFRFLGDLTGLNLFQFVVPG